jgi:Ser/Thr protein kinase RdoA (MazF antagonist)
MADPAPRNTAPVDDELLQAARAFFPDLTAVETVAGHPRIARVTTPAGLRRVHRWPPTATAGEIGFSREVMATARDAGLGLVPALVDVPGAMDEPALRLGARLYTAQEWLPGQPPARSQVDWPTPDDHIDIPAVLAPAQFAQIITAVARLHTATASLAERQDAPAAPFSMLPGAVRQAHERHLQILRTRARSEPAIQRWLATGERLMASAEPIVLQAAPDTQLPAAVLHLGLWPAHVLLAGEPVVGLLGWETVSVGSPLLDLAQATLRLQGWSDEAVETAVGAYGMVRPLTPDERRLLPAVAALDAVATTGRMLEQTYAVTETARPPTALRAGIDTMLRSLSALERSLNAQAAVGKSRRTPWRRTPHPAQRREGGRPRDRRR